VKFATRPAATHLEEVLVSDPLRVGVLAHGEEGRLPADGRHLGSGEAVRRGRKLLDIHPARVVRNSPQLDPEYRWAACRGDAVILFLWATDACGLPASMCVHNKGDSRGTRPVYLPSRAAWLGGDTYRIRSIRPGRSNAASEGRP
jgi:hypothetical protein